MLSDRIINECIHNKLDISPLRIKFGRTIISWFRHIQWRPISLLIKRSDRVIVNETTRTRSSSKIKWIEAIKKDIIIVNNQGDGPSQNPTSFR